MTESWPSVDITPSIDEARQAAGDAMSEEGPFSELMSTYVQLGELLESGRSDEAYVEECRDLVDRLEALGVEMNWWQEQRWFAWIARNTEGVECGQ